MRHIVMFSGGIGSWGAARRVAQAGHAPTLLFADTRTEDPDLYRFVVQAAASVGGDLVTLADGRDIWQVFADERFLGNTRADPCSKILKRQLMRRWLVAECDPADTVVYLGFDWTESHRFDRAIPHWAPWRVEAPLCEPPYRSKAELLSDLRAAGVEPPRLYAMGFPHNNCGGGCVKAGISQFAKLLDRLPDVYADWERHEQGLRDLLGDVAILRDRRGGETRPLTLRALRERIGGGESVPADEFGGCACLEPAEGSDDQEEGGILPRGAVMACPSRQAEIAEV